MERDRARNSERTVSYKKNENTKEPQNRFNCHKSNILYLSLHVSHIAFKMGLSPSKKVVFICFNERLWKIMNNALYFILKALFVLEIFQYLFWLFGYVGKRLDKKAKVNSKICDVTNWITNNYKKHIARSLKK